MPKREETLEMLASVTVFEAGCLIAQDALSDVRREVCGASHDMDETRRAVALARVKLEVVRETIDDLMNNLAMIEREASGETLDEEPPAQRQLQ